MSPTRAVIFSNLYITQILYYYYVHYTSSSRNLIHHSLNFRRELMGTSCWRKVVTAGHVVNKWLIAYKGSNFINQSMLIILLSAPNNPRNLSCHLNFYQTLRKFSKEKSFSQACTFSLNSFWVATVVCPGGVLGISSDGDDRRIFLGFKFSIPGKCGKYFFG